MTSTSPARPFSTARSSVDVLHARRWWALVVLCAAQFIVIVDTSIVAIALPAIQSDLQISSTDLQWVFNAYVVALAGLLLLGGKLADMFGQRNVFVAGFAILTVASVGAGFAQSASTLFLSRGAMGVGAALVAPSALSLLFTTFGAQPRELGRALAFFGAAAPAGGTAGVFLGGVITEWMDWRWTFLINVPFGLAVLAATAFVVAPGSRRGGRLDVLGAITVTSALVIGVYGVVTAPEEGWASTRTLALIGTALALLALFIMVEALHKEPLLRLGVFRVPRLAAGNIAMALLGAAWIPLWFFLNLYLQQVLGYEAFGSGLALLPMTGAIMLLMVVATGRLTARLGLRTNIAAGMGLLVGALLLFAQSPADGNFLAHVLPASLLAAAGMSLVFVPAMVSATAGASESDAGLASGLVNTSYQVGSALGLAAMVAVAQSNTGGTSVSQLNDGFHAAFYGAAVLAAIGVAVALGLMRTNSSPLQPTAAPGDAS
ncbi:MAG: MFS transporter [Dehalococcoidia bacterium]|nr:MFS transporter [Dehalococcoidia bacterium]